jgi:hypothetical protein
MEIMRIHLQYSISIEVMHAETMAKLQEYRDIWGDRLDE